MPNTALTRLTLIYKCKPNAASGWYGVDNGSWKKDPRLSWVE